MISENIKINRKDKIYPFGNVYQITENESGIFYIGSSIDIKTRMANHKSDFYNDKIDAYYKPFYVELRRLNKKITDCTKLTLKEFENISIRELEKFENEFIKKYENDELNFNKNRSQRTIKEYYEENKNKRLEYQKLYNQKNKEILNQKYICNICGGKFTNTNKSKHIKWIKHQKYLNQTN